MKRPLVSVIIATFRRKTSLMRAIESAVNQTYKPLEILVVDDNGQEAWNERVQAIVDAACLAHPEADIRLLVEGPNVGSAQARNAGIQAAKGEYITFLDDDDVYLPEKVEKQLEKMLADQADFGITDLKLYEEDDDSLVDVRVRSYIQKFDPDSLLKYHLLNHMTGTDTLMFKKTYLEKIGSFDHIDVGDEFYLMLKAIENKGVFSYLPQCHVKAYVHSIGGGLSTGTQRVSGEKMLYAYKRRYFSMLTRAEICHVRMRHHAVMAIAYLKERNYVRFLLESVASVLSSPAAFMHLLINRLQKAT